MGARDPRLVASDKRIDVNVSNDVIRNLRDLSDFLRADLRAHGLISWRPHYRLTKPTLYYQRILRLTEYFESRKGNPFAYLAHIYVRVRLARLSTRLGISIPPGVFGRGLSIAHYGSIVVNDQVEAGKYCRIHSATNLGVGEGGSPKLGDFVYIAPGAVLSGGILIGSNAAIGANSVVLSDVPDCSTAVGAPARILKDRSSAKFMPAPIKAVMETSRGGSPCHD